MVLLLFLYLASVKILNIMMGIPLQTDLMKVRLVPSVSSLGTQCELLPSLFHECAGVSLTCRANSRVSGSNKVAVDIH